jgi:hypothetical protein
MRLRVFLVIAPMLLCVTDANRAAADQLRDCLTTAMTSYTKAKLLLLQDGMQHPSVENKIAQRRLEEQYCLQSTRCQFAAQSEQINAALFAQAFTAVFDGCLRDEALEQYDAVPR